MDDSSGSEHSGQPTIVDAWLEPLGDPPCGEDLEWDSQFLEMGQAAAGKPGTQFSDDKDAVPPDWRTVQRLAESLFERTRDVRVAAYWARAQVHLEGALTLPDSFRLIHGLLERYWDDVHPRPDDGDAYARINVLNEMSSAAGLFGDLRQSLVVSSRAIGELRGREVEIALGTLEPRDGEMAPSRDQISQMLGAAADENAALRPFPQRALGHLEKLNELMQERVGYGSAPDLQSLTGLMSGLAGLMPDDQNETASEASADFGFDSGAESAGAGAPAPRRSGMRGGGLGGTVETREDALRAIDMVCTYLERTEPTNPAQFFLRRARKLVDKNFIELVRELAPESLDAVARIMGVSADEISSGSSY
jgi:type VI secretion system protein ImpA